MKLPPQLQKFAVFLIAIICTLGVFYLVYLGMQWVFVYIGSFGLHQPAPSLRVVGGLFLGAILVLRFYLRWRGKKASAKKKKPSSAS